MWVHDLKRGAQKEMDEAYHAALRAFAGGASRAVLVEGLGERAFCSGRLPATWGSSSFRYTCLQEEGMPRKRFPSCSCSTH